MAKKTRTPASTSFLITASAELPMCDHRDNRTKDPAYLELLDGFYDSDPMTQYIHDDALDDVKLTGGIVRCEFDKSKKKLFLLTDFGSYVKLTNPQLAALKSEVSGQWSDGIGESALDDFSGKTGCEVDTCVRSVKVVQQSGGLPFKVDASAKAVLKNLKAKWKQAAKVAAPKNDMKMLIKCFKAVDSKKNGELEQLLSSGKVDVNALCKAKTSEFDEYRLLVVAARRANATIVQTLLDAGADPNLQDEFNYGFAPLHRAKHPSIVKKLLDAGADPNIHTRMFRETPLMYHEVVHKHESVELLLAAGAKPNAKPELGGKSPLLVAVQVNPKSVALLLDAGVKPTLDALNKAVDPGWDGLTNAKQRVEIAEILIRAGVKPTTLTLVESLSGDNPELVRLLHGKGVRLDKRVNAGVAGHQTPLTSAIRYRRTKMLKLLLELGADPNAGKGKDRPLAAAIEEGSFQIVKLLVNGGAELKPVVKGESLDVTAKSAGHQDIAAYFAKLLGHKPESRPAQKKATKGKTAAPKKAAAKPKSTTKKKAAKKSSSSTKKTAKPAAGTRRFEFSDGKSNKFWEISTSGCSYTVCYGRIGTNGQTKTKSFSDDDACHTEADKLIRQKTSKGYSEV